MSSRTLKKLRYVPTGDLRKRGTRPLMGETGTLRDLQSAEQLISQFDKILTDNELIAARFDAISDISVAVSSSLHLEEILNVIVRKARHALGFDYCSLGLVSRKGEEYTLRPLLWPEGRTTSPGEQVFDSTTGLPGAVLASGKPLMVQNLTERPLKVRPVRFLGALDPELEGRLAATGLRSMLALPLNFKESTLGCLVFAKQESNYYDQDDLQIAYLIGQLLATALHNAQLFDAEVRRAHQLTMLNDIGQTATSILDPNALLAKVPTLVQAHFGYDVAKIGLLEGGEVVYAPSAQCIAGATMPDEMRLPVALDGVPAGIVGRSVGTGQMVLVPDVFEDDRWADVPHSLTGPHIRSALVIPMPARDKVLGVLHFESEQVNAFEAADVSILQTLASQLGIALDNARLYQQVNDLFRGYVAPQVASNLLDNPGNAQLGGQRRVVTVLFADLVGFTSVAEKLPPEELLELLNSCLGAATDCVLEHGGTLDKYMGDAVMALFNAPEDQPDHAWRATRAAVAMQRKLRTLNKDREHKLVFSIGINTGEAVVGNIGTASLRNYTAIGDTVNVAKRIQEAALPGQVLVSWETYEAALSTAPEQEGTPGEDLLTVYRLGTEQIKGRTRPAVIYEVNPYTGPLEQPKCAKAVPVREDEDADRGKWLLITGEMLNGGEG